MSKYDLWDQRQYRNAITQAAQEAENWNNNERAKFLRRFLCSPDKPGDQGKGLIAQPNFKTADDVMREKYGE